MNCLTHDNCDTLDNFTDELEAMGVGIKKSKRLNGYRCVDTAGNKWHIDGSATNTLEGWRSILVKEGKGELEAETHPTLS